MAQGVLKVVQSWGTQAPSFLHLRPGLDHLVEQTDYFSHRAHLAGHG